MRMSSIYLIRHGQASFGDSNYDKLSPLGLRQSQILANHFFRTGFLPDAVYCGPLHRHKTTAHELYSCYKASYKQLPPLETLPGFNEYDTPSVLRAAIRNDPALNEHLSTFYTADASFRTIFEAATLRWATGNLDASGFESWEEFKKRVSGSMKDVMSRHDRGKSSVVFTSGGAISACVAHVLDLRGDHAMRLNWLIANASVTRFMYDGDRVTLAGFNSIAHLELEADQSLVTYR